ncbi:hypothetical protein ACTWPT_15020 [Nonomuraea sp. 3N208]|uniref:hypothetical protein n=1 Tax=Nonomuraea sp. 3N208 TaxID=3457421 RepID=UPI003FCDBD99
MDLTVEVGGNPVLRGMSLTVAAGGIVAVVGRGLPAAIARAYSPPEPDALLAAQAVAGVAVLAGYVWRAGR